MSKTRDTAKPRGRFRPRAGGIFLMAITIVCITFLSAIQMLKDIEIPKWGIAEIMSLKLDAHLRDRRIQKVENEAMLSKELKRFRKAMKPFVKSKACKIYVGGK